jgi:ADP-ribose pyrophosphatase YjhB (NUDIX family)
VPSGNIPFRCGRCRFVLYFNAATAVAALVVDARGRMLFIRRARDPGRGRLGWPGGFVDQGESAEEALRRETREEVGLELDRLVYLCSAPNVYPYAGVVYHTLDMFFVATTPDPAGTAALDAVDAVAWLDPAEVDHAELAFPSFRRALERYSARR